MDFLKSRLDPAILKRINPDTLTLESTSFVDKSLAKKYSDLVLSAQIDGEKAYLYLLIELQVEDDENIALRVLEYNVRLMRQHVAQGHSKLPAVINFVIYAGKTPYRGDKSILDAFAYPELFLETLAKDIVVNLREESDTNLLKDKKAALAEWAIKWAHERDFCKLIDNIDFDLTALINESPYGVSVVLYMLNRERHKPNKLLDKLDELEQKQNVMNALQAIEQKGIQIGEQKGIKIGEQRGMQKGREEAVAELLKKGIITQEMANKMLKKPKCT